MKRCRDGGLLVGGRNWYPVAPEDYAWANIDVPIACNHLRCSTCGQDVTMTPAGDVRVYRCACGGEEISAPRWLAAPRPGPETWYAWGCAGHPDLALPGALDGVALDAETIGASARAGLEGRVTLPWAGSEPTRQWLRHPGFGVARLYALVPGDADEGGRRVQRAGDVRRAILTTVEVALDDAAPDVRRRAVCFFEHHPVSARIADLVGAELAAPGRWIGVPDPLEPGVTLWDSLLDALITRANAEARAGKLDALDAAWRVLLAGRGHSELLYLIGRHDPARIGAGAAELVAAGLRTDVVLLAVSDDADIAERAVRSLAAAGVSDLEAAVDKRLSGIAHTRAKAALAPPGA